MAGWMLRPRDAVIETSTLIYVTPEKGQFPWCSMAAETKLIPFPFTLVGSSLNG